ncbi:hypothetical protein M422DRAFT_63367 [Sphaerobolus stellatus SS14]|nr:hypothetical protein M422DRAFT_63367 [Sphaerobolus stellatus SS14]
MNTSTLLTLSFPLPFLVAITHSQTAVFDGPIELVKIIFDTAAHDSKSSALSLLRTCKTSREWALPALYTDVHVASNGAAIRLERTLEAQYNDHQNGQNGQNTHNQWQNGRSERLPAHAERIKTLSGSNLPDVDVLARTCQGLERLTLQNYDVQRYLGRLEMRRLRHVTIAGQMRYVKFAAPPPQGHGQGVRDLEGGSGMIGLKNVTHLRFANDVPRLPEEFMTSYAPRLSHFSCTYHLSGVARRKVNTSASGSNSGSTQWDGLERCLATVLKGTGVRVVLVYVHTVDRYAAEGVARMIMAAFGGDARIVVATGVELPEETTNLSALYDAGWVYAERKLGTRRMAAAGNARC